jgi:sugar transferase (PEP-CTERM/EpsH1 system associated)
MAQRIRVMHVLDNLGKGGLENGLANLIENLDQCRYEHVVCALRRLGPNADRVRAAGARVMCLEKPDGRQFQAGILRRVIHEVNPDLVHSRNWPAIETVLAGRWARCRAVVHGEHGLEADTSAKEPWRRSSFRRLAFELADRVLSVSGQLRDLHARRTGFPASRITVIHNGVDSERYRPDEAVRARVRAEFGIPEGQFCIGCVGNLTPAKDYLTALKGIRAFDASGCDWRLIIIGEGPERSRLEAFAGAHPQWRHRVTFLGLSHRVPELLPAFDTYLLSSVIEGISNSLLEAMATALPVVASAVGGNPEVVIDSESGLLFPAGDVNRLAKSLRNLQANSQLRLSLGRGARRRVREQFSLDAMVRQYQNVYEDLTAAVSSRMAAAV